MSRAYLALAAWREFGLDGCFIGPPALKDTPAIAANSLRPDGCPITPRSGPAGSNTGPEHLPVRPQPGEANLDCGWERDRDARRCPVDPAAAKGLAEESEIKTWQSFLAPPLGALAKRMEWLEALNPGNLSVKLHAAIRN